jgi:hypothetical protein
MLSLVVARLKAWKRGRSSFCGLGSAQFFDVAEVAGASGGPFVSQQVLAADEVHLDIAIASAKKTSMSFVNRGKP